MKKVFLKMAAVIAAAAIFTSCDKGGTEVPEAVSFGNALVLNNGNWGGNDACITSFNLLTGEASGSAFKAANGQALGDLAQDILVDEGDVYIAVYGSQLIFVTDHDLKVKKTIIAEADGNKLSPRALTKSAGKVYVTYYEGYLGEIDPSKEYKVKTVKVGANPEGVAYAGGKLYVANSGGMNYPDYEKTLSVVDAASFEVTASIEVNLNPAKVYAAGNYVYVSSFGNYADVPAKLQCVDIRSGAVTDTPYSNVSSVALVPFVTDGTTFPIAYSISAAADGSVYVGCSDYVSTGDVYVMTSAGTLQTKFDSQGFNPIAVAAL